MAGGGGLAGAKYKVLLPSPRDFRARAGKPCRRGQDAVEGNVQLPAIPGVGIYPVGHSFRADRQASGLPVQDVSLRAQVSARAEAIRNSYQVQ